MSEANLNGLFSALRTVLLLFGAFLAQNGMGHSGIYFQVEMAASAILIIGPGVWGIWAAVSNILKAHAVGVQAGINLTVEGKAITDSGEVISRFADAAATPPKAVTIASAKEIVAAFAPPSNTIAKV